MVNHWQSSAEDIDAVKNWFDTWTGYVQRQDFTAARRLFAEDVAAFGTHVAVVDGLDALEAEQWRQVWPSIDGFRFQTESLKLGVAADGLMAVGLCPWHSTGFSEDGTAFDRPGRASVVFQRPVRSDPWKGIHTHFSLAPGTPQRFHGKPVD